MKAATATLALLTAITGCQTAGPIGGNPLANRSASMQPVATAKSPTHDPSSASTIALVGHEQPVTDVATDENAQPDGIKSPTEPAANNQGKVTSHVEDNELYVGQYESVGFRNRVQSGLCDHNCAGCGSCRPAPSACVACPKNQYPTPVPCDFPIDPNEYICDGGDRMPDARVLIDNQVRGLGLEDTIVHYETQDGLTYVEPSNRVCLYARFAAVRKVTSAVTGENVLAIQRVAASRGTG
ncbi:MAG: hypothetical protein R3C05_13425 [Pirellulaceae bacterium]